MIQNACHKAVDGFERPALQSSPRIDGDPVAFHDAIARAASLLAKAKQPLFGGLATDVAGMRAVMALAEQTAGIVDHMHGDGMMRNYLTLQEQGWITTTLAEIKNRADLIVFVGTDASDYPRFFERCIWNKRSMFGLKPTDREIVYIGSRLDAKAGVSPSGRKPQTIPCETARVGEVVSAIGAILDGVRLTRMAIAGVKKTLLEKLAARMREAKYGVIVWEAAKLDFPHAELAVQVLCELIRTLNKSTRFGGFPLGGNDGSIGAANACAWLSGYPLRIGFVRGYPEYDPARHRSEALLSSGNADTLVWISTISGQQPPPSDVPTIVLGAPRTRLKRTPKVFFPVGTPGLDHPGQLFRCDGVISLRARQVRSSDLPSVAEALYAIKDAL